MYMVLHLDWTMLDSHLVKYGCKLSNTASDVQRDKVKVEECSRQ